MDGVGQWGQNQERGQEDLGLGNNGSRLHQAYFLKRKTELQEACPLLVDRRVATASHLSLISVLSFLFPESQFVAIAAHSSYLFTQRSFPDGFSMAVLLFLLSLTTHSLNIYQQTHLRRS